ncbi:hypothetical protein G7039_29155 (plasmid) [Rhizobium leguminosarum]|nr:hypothetical protein G7039_29155 [Rhizobium leguminosarum]
MYVEKTMTAEEIVGLYKEVNALLTQLDYSTRRRAILLGKTAQTLKQYSVNPESAQPDLVCRSRQAPCHGRRRVLAQSVDLHVEVERAGRH